MTKIKLKMVEQKLIRCTNAQFTHLMLPTCCPTLLSVAEISISIRFNIIITSTKNLNVKYYNKNSNKIIVERSGRRLPYLYTICMLKFFKNNKICFYRIII